MSLTLTITDNQDGTGATATITGSDAGSTNTVYTSPVNQGNGPLAWTSRGSRTGDGTLTLGPPLGYYFAYASGTVATLAALAAPVIYAASAGADSVQEQVELAVQARIQTLTLSGLATPPGNLPASRVYHFSTPASDDLLPLVTTPCVLVCPGSVPESVENVVTERDDIGYPVETIVLDRYAPRYQQAAPTTKLWRQQIFRSLRFQPLYSVGTGTVIGTVKPEPRPVLAWKPPDYDYVYSAVLFRCISREGRV